MKKAIIFRKIMAYLLHLIIFMALLSQNNIYSQVNCTEETPHITVDLSTDPSMTIETIAVIRDGSCCEGADDNCVEFTIYLHPDAEGILFDVASGANPGGALDYQINCGPITASGSAPICLDGEGPHNISFCKPGANQNTYQITSVPGPSASENVTAADGCTDTLFVAGLDPESITWNSIAPGGYGEYNHLLSNEDGTQTGTAGVGFTGHETVLVTPDLNSPSEIQYEVCGSALGSCSSNLFCDTITVTIVPDLEVQINPEVPSICFGGTDVELLANVTGGEAPYSFVWSTGETTQEINISNGGTYIVEVSDQTGCFIATDTVEALVFENSITANAGPDVAICQNPIPTVSLTGTVTGTTTGEWSGGDGTYDGSNADLNLNYTPSANEIDEGFVTLTLTPTNTGECPFTTDEVTISLTEFTSDIQMIPSNVTCNNEGDGEIILDITAGNPAYTISNFVWSNGETTQNLSGLDPGDYEVLITDENGCEIELSAIITEPEPLIVSIIGDDILCFGDSDGNVTGTISGGTAPYTVTLNETGDILNIENDGDSYDFSGLNGLPSGGSDEYTVTVTDANGNNGGCETTVGPVVMTEPEELIVTINGDNILCFGDSDGNVTGTISGGTAPYTVTLNETGDILNIENDGDSYDFSGLNGLPSGGSDEYTVTVTDANGNNGGCETTVGPAVMTEPEELVVTINGDNILCFGDSDGNVTGTISGGTAPYVVTLNETGDVLNIANEGDSYDFTNLNGLPSGGFDEYTVTVTDANGNNGGCVLTVGPVTMTEPQPLAATINGDNILCFGDGNGNVTGTVSGGTPPYEVALNETESVLNVDNDGDDYDFPNLNGLPSGGFDEYTINVKDANGTTGGCITDAGPAPMIEPQPLDATINGDNILCFGDGDGNVTGSVSGGTAPYEVTLNETGAVVTILNDGDNYDFADLNGLPSGGFNQYTVTVTDANGNSGGCSISVGPVRMGEPEELVVTINGDEILCFGDGDGNITGTISGGTAPYTIVLNETGDILNIENDGGSYDFANLHGLESGGFEEYTVTVTDANGNTGGCSTTAGPVPMSEPEPLSSTLTPSVYEGGYNVSGCVNDGTIDVDITGGTATYSYAWTGPNGFTSVSEDLTELFAGTYSVTVTDMNSCELDTVITLTEPTGLIQSAEVSVYPNGDNISCFGAADGFINITTSQGVTDYSWNWTGPNGFNANTENIADLVAGEYSLTITDANGCTIDTVVTLTEPDPLVQDISSPTFPSGDNISCFEAADGEVIYTVSGGSPGYDYSWNTGAITDNLSGLEPGTYSVSITDINGCSIDTSITLTEPEPLDITLEPSVYQGGFNTTGCSPDGEIEAVVSGGSANYTYDWSNGANESTNSNLEAGSYEVIITDINGCTITDEITLTAKPIFTVSLEAFVYSGGANVSCAGAQDGSISLETQDGASPFTFEWNTGATSQNLSDLPVGEYTVIVTDANGCINHDTIVLLSPEPLNIEAFVSTNYNGSDISCFAADDGGVQVNVNGGTPNYAYEWTDSEGANIGAGNQLNNLAPGLYTVVVTDQHGCTIDENVTVSEPDEVLVEINILTDFDGLPVNCENTEDGSITANSSGGTGNHLFSWDTDPVSNTQTLTNVGVGTYNVTTTDANGCQATSSVVLEGHPIPGFSYSDYGLYCEGDAATVSSITEASNTCHWVFSSGQQVSQCGEFTIDLNTSGCVDAELFVTNEFGCVNSEFIADYICFEPIPDASFNQSDFQITTIPSNVQFWSSSGGGYHYEWDFGDGFGSDEMNPNHFFPDDEAGTYEIQLVVTSMFGCVDTSYSVVEVQEEFLMYVPNTFTPDGDQFNETFRPVLTSGYDPYSYHLMIFNRWGEVLFESYDTNVGWDGTYGGKTVKDGTYIWKINVSDKANAQVREIKGHVNVLR